MGISTDFFIVLASNTTELLPLIMELLPKAGMFILWCMIPISFVPWGWLYARYMNKDMPEWVEHVSPNCGYILVVAYVLLTLCVYTFGPKLKPFVSALLEEPQYSASTHAKKEVYQNAYGSNEVYVWITEKGKRYHASPDCSNMKAPYRVSLNDAQDMGRTPCTKCEPPE